MAKAKDEAAILKLVTLQEIPIALNGAPAQNYLVVGVKKNEDGQIVLELEV